MKRSPIRRCGGVLALFAWLFLIASSSPAAPEATEPLSLEAMRAQLTRQDAVLTNEPDDTALVRARDTAASIQTQAEALATAQQPKLTSLDARLAELGAAPKDPSLESDEVRAQRVALSDQRNDVDAEIRQARVLSVEAGQIIDRVATIRQASFQAALFQRAAPPYSFAFWSALGDNRLFDLARLDRLDKESRAALAGAMAPDARARFIGSILLAGLLLLATRWWGERYVRRRTTQSMPPGRLRRSALVLGITVAFTASAWISARLIFEGLGWNGALPDRIRELATFCVGLATFCALLASFGRGLLSCASASWRLPPLPDEVACALRFVPAILGAVVFITSLLEYVNGLISGSLALSVAISCLVAMLLTAVLVSALLAVHRARSHQALAPQGKQARRELSLNVILAFGWCAAAVSMIAVLTGYIALGNFVAKQVIWAAFVLSAMYLLLQLTDDLITSALASRGRAGVELHDRFGVAPRRVDQLAVLLSGGARLVLVILALAALVTPYGAGPGDLLGRQLQGAARGIAIGELVLSPDIILRGFLVFVLATFVFHRFRRWFEERYLPTTLLEPGMQSSLASLTGYAGAVLAVAMALAAIGVSLERITWIASALSVGIGFGLQAIVQNFVSGLILLVERPVKVGDWVIVGDAEGDIRRINVRATEIRTGDRTTVLVPNSELITKIVRNRTHSNAEGLVKVLLPMPLSIDVDITRILILEVFKAHPAILKEPAPAVFLDDVGAGRVVFNASAFVVSPRMVYGVRSEILFEIVRRLQGAGILIYEPPAIQGAPLAP